MFLIYIIFIFFTIGGFAAFLGFSVSPVIFWLQYGYWNLADPPKMILLGTCFLAVHGAFGIGGLLYLRKTAPDENVDTDIHSIDQPWLNKTYWNKETIQSKRNLRLDLAQFASRYFAIISIFALFAISESIKLIDYTAMAGLIFPLLALYFYIRFKKMQEHQYRYQSFPLTLASYPAFIGEKCHGKIQLTDKRLITESASIELRCVLRKQAGDAEVDFEQEKLWHEKIDIDYSTSKPEKILSFSFDLKHGLKQAQAAEEYPSITWEIHLCLKYPDGSKIKREYHNIPVFNPATT